MKKACEECKGSGEVDITCRYCNGSGMIRPGVICCSGWDTTTCTHCNGTGEVDDE